MEEQAETNTGQRATAVLADAGYKSEANFAALEQRGVDAYVSLGKGEDLRAPAEEAAGPARSAWGGSCGLRRGAGGSSGERRSWNPSTDGSNASWASGASRCVGSGRRKVSGASSAS